VGALVFSGGNVGSVPLLTGTVVPVPGIVTPVEGGDTGCPGVVPVLVPVGPDVVGWPLT